MSVSNDIEEEDMDRIKTVDIARKNNQTLLSLKYDNYNHDLQIPISQITDIIYKAYLLELATIMQNPVGNKLINSKYLSTTANSKL